MGWGTDRTKNKNHSGQGGMNGNRYTWRHVLTF